MLLIFFAKCCVVAAFTSSLALFTRFAEVYLHSGLLHQHLQCLLAGRIPSDVSRVAIRIIAESLSAHSEHCLCQQP